MDESNDEVGSKICITKFSTQYGEIQLIMTSRIILMYTDKYNMYKKIDSAKNDL